MITFDFCDLRVLSDESLAPLYNGRMGSIYSIFWGYVLLCALGCLRRFQTETLLLKGDVSGWLKVPFLWFLDLGVSVFLTSVGQSLEEVGVHTLAIFP